MKKLFTLLVLLVAIVTGAQAQDVPLFTTDFTESGWNSLNATETAQTLTIGSQTVYVRANNTGNLLSVNTSTGTLTWGNRNFSNKDCYMAIPLTGVNGSVTISIKNGDTDTRFNYATSTSETVANPSSTVSTSSGNPSVVTIENVEGNFLMVYLGRQGSGLKNATSITITTPAPAGPSITTQPQSASYLTGQTIAALTVAATPATATFQWYSCDDTNKTNAKPIEGANSSSYTPSAAGFYYVAVTAGGVTVNSDVAQITVSAATAPNITVSGAPAEAVKVGANVVLTAEATGTPTPTITWYNGNDESVATKEATELTYTVPTTTAGTYTFYAVAANGVGTNATSAPLTITVKEQVAKPTISPATAMFTDGSTEVTIECTTTGATIQYSTDGGKTWADYSSALTIDATTTLIAKAVKDGYLDSETATGSYTKIDYTMTPLVPVSTATTWDWSGMSTTVQLKDDGTTIPPKGHTFDVNAADFDGTILPGNAQWPTTFAASSLAFTQSEYPVRGTYYQGYTVKFQAAVPGIVKVYYSNTSKKDVARYANINGTNYGAGSKNSTLIWTEEVPVEAGMVTITGMEGESTPNYIHIQKIVFTPRPESIDLNITAAAGATTVYSDFALDFSTLTNAKAYIETGTGDKLSWTQVPSAPAKTGLLVVSSETKLTVPTAASSATVVTGNRLKGVATGDESKIVSADDNIYIFTLHEGKPGFIKSETGRSLLVGKAYLDLGEEATGAREFFDLFEDDTTTGISSIDNDQLTTDNDAPAYNLAGQKVGKGYKGIVIINGKKVVK